MNRYVKYDVGPVDGKGRRMPILGCNHCADHTAVVHTFGFRPTFYTEEMLLMFGEDAVEKARAYRVCPKCGSELVSGDWFVLEYRCEKCHSKVSSRDFCVICGNGMAPGLFKKLARMGLHPIMAGNC